MSLAAAIRVCWTIVAGTSAAMVLSLQLQPALLAALLTLVLLPLLLLAPGLWRGRDSTYRAAMFVAVFYVGFALTEVIALPDQRWLPGLLMLASTAWIALWTLAIRRGPVRRSPAAPRE